MSDGITDGARDNARRKGELQDGGTRKTYTTGAQKEDQSATDGKGRYDLLPITAIRRVAEIFRKGAIKYDDRNWEKGLPLSRFLDSAKRHIDQYQEGLEDEDHLAQAAWNLLALLHTEEMIKRGLLPKELDDMPSYMPTDADPEMWRQIGRWASEDIKQPSQCCGMCEHVRTHQTDIDEVYHNCPEFGHSVLLDQGQDCDGFKLKDK